MSKSSHETVLKISMNTELCVVDPSRSKLEPTHCFLSSDLKSSIFEGSPCPEAVGFRQIAQLLVRPEDHKWQDHLKTSKSRLNDCRNALQLPGRQTTCQSRPPRSRTWNAPPPRPCPQAHQLQRSQGPPVTLSCTSYIIITKVIHIKYKNVPTCQVWAVMAARAMGKV